MDEVQFYFTPNDNTIQFRSVRHRRGSSSGCGGSGGGVLFGGLGSDFGEARRRLKDIRIALGLEKVPVLRNRRRVFFVESLFDTFGPPTIQFERLVDSISGDMDGKAVQGSVLGELDPSRPVWDLNIIRMYNKKYHAALTITKSPVYRFVITFNITNKMFADSQYAGILPCKGKKESQRF